MAQALKPCPFCGNTEKDEDGFIYHERIYPGDYSHIMCGGCSCSGPIGLSKSEATDAWNRRLK